MSEIKWITKNGVHIPITNEYMNNKIKSSIPMYNGKIDYTGDFRKTKMSELNDNQLKKAVKVQQEQWSYAYNRRIGVDLRTKEGKEVKQIKHNEIEKYSKGLERLKRELRKRNYDF